MSIQTHRSDPQVLNRRTLEVDHRVLAGVLRPGMSVLDVGCGTGAITAGIARLTGTALGMDRDDSLLAIARRDHADIPGLTFEQHDAVSMEFPPRFDAVTAARALQWISDPGAALGRMAKAAKAGGLVVVLDYNHGRNQWEPDAPAAFVRFYEAFLAWRAANQWDNEMADHLPVLFTAAGLTQIGVFPSDEAARRGSPAAEVWAHVITSVGTQIVVAGFLTEDERLQAAHAYREYLDSSLERQTLSMATVTGVRPRF
jgi:SAM-dependent methyltransferase